LHTQTKQQLQRMPKAIRAAWWSKWSCSLARE